MDLPSATAVIRMVEEGKVKLKQLNTSMPSPFAFNIVLDAHTDVLRMEDKLEFLKRMHQMTLARIGSRFHENWPAKAA